MQKLVKADVIIYLESNIFNFSYVPNVVLPLPIWQENTHCVEAGSFFNESTRISKQLSSGALSSTTGTNTY